MDFKDLELLERQSYIQLEGGYPMRWWRPTSWWSVREHQNINKASTEQLYIALFDKSTANMGRKRTSKDIDFIDPPRTK